MMVWPTPVPTKLQVDSPDNGHLYTTTSIVPTSKRRKIEIACEICRLRKSRCDGARPKCGACMRRKNVGSVCNYTELPRRDQASDESIEISANTPIRVVQGHEESPRGPVRMRARSLHSSVDDCSPRSILDSSNPYQRPIECQTRHSSALESREQAAVDDKEDTENDHDVTGHADSWIVRAGLLGASSSASFIQSICKAVGKNETPKPQNAAPNFNPQRAPTQTTLSELHPRVPTSHSADYVLPPRKRADQLLAMHWERSHIPWIDRARMMHWYEGLWSGREDMNHDINEQIYYCTLNVVFAISYIDLDSPELDSAESKHLSRVHFSRAQRLLSFNLLNISYISLVQVLLVMIQYFQSTNMIRQCFQCTGLAILIAQNLGLHLPHTTARIASQHDREMARRAWHGCILVDRITSMIYSQPMRLSQEVARNSPLPAAIDDEYLEDGTAEGVQPPELPSRLQFFRVFCKLHFILGDILSTFYAGRSSANREDADGSSTLAGPDVNQIMHFDKALDEWLESVDEHLRIKADHQVVNLAFKGQALNLHARFLHIRLLLYRTFFSQRTSELLAQQNTMQHNVSHQVLSFADSVSSQGLLTCVQIAQQLLQLLLSNIDGSNPAQQVPPWWHVISYVYSTVTILVAAHLFPVVVERISADSLNASIQQGFGILEHYVTNEKPAQRCKAALSVLYEKMNLASNTSKDTPNRTYVPQDPSSSVSNGRASDVDGDLPIDFAWADIIGSSDLFSGEHDFHWLYDAPFADSTSS